MPILATSALDGRLRCSACVVALASSLVLLAATAESAGAARSYGALTQFPGEAGCVSEDEPGCARARGLALAGSLAISPDGLNVYVATYQREDPDPLDRPVGSDGLAVFARDPTTGALTQLPGEAGCANQRGDSGCAAARGTGMHTFFAAGTTVAVSPDGRNVYLASDGAVAVFSREAGTGALSQLPGAAGCVRQDAQEGCARGRALDGGDAVAVSPDNRSVYVSAWKSSAVALFARDPETGALTQPAGEAGCVAVRRNEGCAIGRQLEGATAVTSTARNVYVVSDGRVNGTRGSGGGQRRRTKRLCPGEQQQRRRGVCA
jgi:DNA-binding beta-propeller fold protein YncE